MSLQRVIVKNLLAAPLSLADLQLATQVSLPTLRRAVQGLTDARWIRIVGQAEANGGRPAMLFGIDASFFVIVGVHLQLPGIRLILADLAGQVLEETEFFDSTVPTPNEVVQSIIDYVARIRTTFVQRQLLGIGIATPGFIDLNTGDIISIGRVPTWESFPMRRRLQTALNLPVHIANDVDCMAFAELQYTHEPRESNLAYIGFDEGVKVSLFLKGSLHKGALGNAGLLAAQLLQVRGLPDAADAARLLTINGMNRCFEERLALLDGPAQTRYASIAAATSPRERVSAILAGAHADLPVCQTLVQEQTKILAVAVATVVLMIQPDIIVIGGLLSLLPPGLFAALEAEIRGYLPELISNNTVIQQGKLASQSNAAIGANHHFLQVLLDDATRDLA
jgi:predicted NBD/HSP70 family sugar kinase